MGFIDALLRPFRAMRRKDPWFGTMLYMGGRSGYCEGKATFTPTGSVIEVFVDGLADDDMEQQHEFFQQLVREWPTLRDEIGKILLERWREQEPEHPISSPWEQFQVSSLSIPKAPFETAEWDVSFGASADPNHLWTVSMKGRQPHLLVADG